MNFTKTSRQKEAIKVLSGSAKHIMLEGGSRSGKSFILMFAMIVRASKETSRHAILRLNFNAAKRSIWNDTLPTVMRLAFPELRTKQNKSELIQYFPNGSEIHVGGLDDGERVEKILGTEYSSLWFNEVSQIPYDSAQIAISRLAQKNNLAKKIYYDQNPGKKNSWPYWLFHKHINPIDQEPVFDPENYTYLHMNPKDNLDHIDPEYLKVLESMPAEQRKRFLEGEYTDESDGQTYYAFRQDRHVKPVERRPGTIFIAEDFNVDPGTALIFQYIDKTFYILDEVFLRNSDTYKMASEFKSRNAGGARIIPDSTGGNRKTSGKSDFDILKEAGFIIESTYNPFVTDRVTNVNRLFSNDKIVIDPKCKKLINDLEKVVWKDNRLDQSGPNKLLTHISDCLGYAAWKLDPIAGMAMKATTHAR